MENQSAQMPALGALDMSGYASAKPTAKKERSHPKTPLSDLAGLNDVLRTGLEANRLYRAVEKVLSRKDGYRERALQELEEVMRSCSTLRQQANRRK